MKKVKIMASANAIDLENAINEFIVDKHIIDIKFSSVIDDKHIQPVVEDRVLIIYEEQEGK